MDLKNTIIFSFDGETIGLYGEPFAISYVVCNLEGEELENGYISCPIENANGDSSNREWVFEHVIPHIPGKTNYETPKELCEAFYRIWIDIKSKYKQVIAVADCGYPIEANIFFRAIKPFEKTRQFTGPYPLHEVGTALLIAGMNPVDYPRIENELPIHHPLKDARYAARLFLIALKKSLKRR